MGSNAAPSPRTPLPGLEEKELTEATPFTMISTAPASLRSDGDRHALESWSPSDWNQWSPSVEYAETLRRLEEACLTPIIPLTTERIKAIRERERVSQAVFVNNLNVTRSLMSKGNRGERVWRSTDWRLWR